MRLYLSSFRLGDEPPALLERMAVRTTIAVIANGVDFRTSAERPA